jgi:hypothetical protein
MNCAGYINRLLKTHGWGRIPSRSMGVVITKVTETVRALTVTRTVNVRNHVQYPLVTRILAPCREDNHQKPTIPLNSSYYSGVSGMVGF